MYGWVETEQKWKTVDQSDVFWMGIGERGRLYQIDSGNYKVFQQKQTPLINKCLAEEMKEKFEDCGALNPLSKQLAMKDKEMKTVSSIDVNTPTFVQIVIMLANEKAAKQKLELKIEEQ